MSESRHLLFELGTEELPPKSLLQLSETLLVNICSGLQKSELSFGASYSYATPRRLAILIENVSAAQADKNIEKRGPAVQAAFAADGTPGKAAEGFAKSCATSVNKLSRLKTDKGEWLAYVQQVKGKSAQELLPDIIRQAIATLPIAKKMRWGSGTTEFVRPVHWAVLLYGNETISTKILGITTSNQTCGHRFYAPEAIIIQKPETYQDQLLQSKVIADFDQRKSNIRTSAIKAAEAVGGKVYIEEKLLEEITALNEWPVPITGNFATRFLDLPAEVLITTMQINQKYFPVKDLKGRLLPHFITFSNIESTRPESVQTGNERVILPRLVDAEFFWSQDKKRRLDERVLDLSSIVFQEKLGTLADKTRRIEFLSTHIAELLKIDPTLVRRAALLSKTDLMTDMVGEFPSLQGVIGRYYALADNEHTEVALALEEQYFPKQSGSPVPSSTTGQILSLAEKLDTLTGIFSTGLIPSGDKDPYALRRATLGILRIIIENRLDLDIVTLLKTSLEQFSHEFDIDKTLSLITDFVYDRMKSYCLEQGYSADEFDAVISVLPSKPLDFEMRLQAVREFKQLPEAASLASANKRIRNILKKSSETPSQSIALQKEPEEKQLLQDAQLAAVDIQPLLAEGNYKAALNRLAELRDCVDQFFDNVMVMTDDPELRASRLGLLDMLAKKFLQIADISKLQILPINHSD